jgi:Protein of unknown function (DUF1822)
VEHNDISQYTWTPRELSDRCGLSYTIIRDIVVGKSKGYGTIRAHKSTTGQWLIFDEDALDFIKRYPKENQKVFLHQWLENVYAGGWQPLENFANRLGGLAFRSLPQSSVELVEPFQGISRVPLGRQAVALLLSLDSHDSALRIQIQVLPMGKKVVLPEGLTLSVRLSSGEARSVRASQGARQILISLEDFESGEEFGTLVSLGDISVDASFVV